MTQSRKDAIDFMDSPYEILITLMAHVSSKRRAIVFTRYFEAYSVPAWLGIALVALVRNVKKQWSKILSYLFVLQLFVQSSYENISTVLTGTLHSNCFSID